MQGGISEVGFRFLFTVISTARLLVAVLFAVPLAAQASAPTESIAARMANVPAELLGRSGALKAVLAQPGEALTSLFGWSSDAEAKLAHRAPGAESAAAPGAPQSTGIWTLSLDAQPLPVSLINAVPFSAKRNGFVNGYRIGTWPAEKTRRTGDYAPPDGFIEVTRENQDTYVSKHFRLKDFLTKNQADVWPKYLVLDLQLIDKLELVIQELNAMGHEVTGLHVMSGFRTPQYNGPGGNGRAKFSRHTYGDAADVWVDEDANGYMDDLNRDGKINTADAAILVAAVERIEERYPELIGGAGVYKANRVHGPFVHIDARGRAARWGKL